MKENNDAKDVNNDIKFESKDLLAIIIAQFQILIPIVLIAAFVFGLIFLLLTKFWIRA